MAGITASGPMGRIRSKDEVSGPRKPKERGNKPNGQHGQQAHGKKEK